MTAVTYPSTLWKNSDGLRVRFGTDVASDAVVGAPWTQGAEQVLVVDLDYTRFPAFSATYLYGNNATAGLPSTAIITGIDFYTDVAWDSAADALTLSVGLAKKDGTIIDDNALIDAATQSELNANTAYSASNQGASAPSGGGLSTIAVYNSLTVATDPMVYVTVSPGTATATVGHSTMRIHYYTPSADDGGAYSA